jgi:hypothetical protein
LGVQKYCSELLNYFDFCYGSCTRLILQNGFVIGFSKNGIRQGDPLGPLFYALGLQSVLEEVKHNFPNVDICYFLDDGFLHGYSEETVTAYYFLQDRLKHINQLLDVDDPKKIILFSTLFNPSSAFFPKELNVSSDGILCLGCPFGSDNFINENLSKIIKKLSSDISDLKNVDVRCSFLLTRFCINTRGTYHARVCFPGNFCKFANKFDSCVDSLISYWAGGSPLDSISSKIRGLPWGLNLSRLEDISIPAFTNSFTRSLEFGKSILNGSLWKWAVEWGDELLSRYCQCLKIYCPDFSFSDGGTINSQFDNSVACFNTIHNNLIEEFRNLNQPELASMLIGNKFLYSSSPVICFLNWFNSERKIPSNSYIF